VRGGCAEASEPRVEGPLEGPPSRRSDADHDLRVSADELRAAIRRSTHAPPVVPLVDGILRSLDADRDGYISRGESDEV
jgi:Ca2+-binding EF-hand superfamily protein